MRFTEYVYRFVRLASRYEEEVTGATKFGHPSTFFTEIPGQAPKLGSGIAFVDEATCSRELAANAHRIEAWRKTSSYQYCVAVRHHPDPVGWMIVCTGFLIFMCFVAIQDHEKLVANSAIKGFDVLHQLVRVRHAKNLADAEILAIMRALADNVRTYEQVVEVCCLFHNDYAQCY